MISHEHTVPDGGCKDAHVQTSPSDAVLSTGTDKALALERLSKLSPRESEVLDRIADGHPTKVIAADLGIGVKTVEFHRAQLMSKTGCRSLFELGALWGVASGAWIVRALKHDAPLEGGVALRTALATVSAASGDSSRLPKLDRLSITQLRQRALDDRKDAHAAVQCRDIVTAAMLLADADRCEVRAERLDDRPALQR